MSLRIKVLLPTLALIALVAGMFIATLIVARDQEQGQQGQGDPLHRFSTSLAWASLSSTPRKRV